MAPDGTAFRWAVSERATFRFSSDRAGNEIAFIESQGAFDAASAPAFLMLARDLVREGSTVEILLVQNGVMPARKGAKADGIAAAIQAGVAVWADEFSMKERALAQDGLSRGIRPAAIGVVVIFGVAFSTLLSLYVVPPFYALLAPYTRSPEALSKQLERLEVETPEVAGNA